MKRPLAIIIVLSLSPAVAAAAEPAKSTGDPAAAQALFYEARGLMQKGRWAEACPKLEESLRLDQGIGTAYNLADCHEHVGKLATAWSGFLDVAAAAKAAGQTQREKVARERAQKLEPKLPKMVVDVRSAPQGLVVKRDGVVVGAAAFNTPIPVDPGAHKITATAPGRETFETSVDVAEGKTARVVVKELAVTPAPVVATAPAAGAPATPPAATPGTGTTVSATTTTSATPGDGSADTQIPSAFPEPVVEQRSPQRTIGWVVGGLGVVGLGVGSYFGLRSIGDRSEARDHCSGDRCDATGVGLRDDALRNGNISTIAMIGGGAAVVGGLVLVLTAPRDERRVGGLPPGPRIGRVSASPQVGPGSAGFVIGGTLP